MARVQDVADYILRKQGAMTAMKLQKECYYCQAWHLVWEGMPLFGSDIEAWANGPVIPDLYRLHRGRFTLNPGDIKGDRKRLAANEVESIDVVLDFYGELGAHTLSEMTHREAPWQQARTDAGLAPMERGNAVISHAAMAEYYEALSVAED